jgi:hypothetical protein
LVFGRTYSEQSSEAQRSVKSSSANDANPGGSGAKRIRITYLTSSYVLKTEDVALNGTTGVNTAASDIRFIESLEVIEGTNCAGAVTLQTTTGGGGTEIMGIASGTTQTFAAHHYVPAGKRCILLNWGATVDDEASLKLATRDQPDTTLVDRIADLEKLFASNPTPPTRITFERSFIGGYGSPEAIVLPEKSYARITVVPNQATSTTIRAWFSFWEVNT